MRKGLTLVLSLILTAFLSSAGFAQVKPAYVASRTFQSPVIDGRLDDPAWQQAGLLTGLVKDGSSTARFKTEFRFVWDEEALYVAVRAEEPNMAGLVVKATQEDNAYGDDCIEIFIDPNQTRRQYIQHIISASGLRATAWCTDTGAPIGAEIKTSREAGAWILEIRMPFADMRTAPRFGDRWGLDVARHRIGKGHNDPGEYSYWSPGRTPYATPQKYGTLIFGPFETPEVITASESDISEYVRWKYPDVNFKDLNRRLERLHALAMVRETFTSMRLLYAVRPAITDEPILPWTVPEPEEIGNAVKITACRGEFESASLLLYADKYLKDIQLKMGDLYNENNEILPASILEPYHVICWYQTGICDNYNRQITLVPELLMRNPTLVEADPKARQNILHFEGVPRDATALQPIDIPALESRQFWLNFRIPADAKPGVYRGDIHINDSKGPYGKVPVILRVPEWDLAPSPLLHGLYYGRRPSGELKTVDEENAFFAKVEAELKDQIEHGCNITGIYIHMGSLPSDPSPFATGNRVDAIQKKYGVKDTPYFLVVYGVGHQSGEALKDLTNDMRRMSSWAKERGRAGFVVQGRDEAPPEVQRTELPAWEAVQKGGGMVFVAGGDMDVAGPLLNFPVVGGRLKPEIARKAHALGVRVLSYANPFTAPEMPERHRRNFGLALWAAGYDGALNFCYGDTEENPNAWNESADSNWRHTSFAYPAQNGPIGTIQFEGWREGIDDIRYAVTLKQALDRADVSGNNAKKVQESRDWLNSLTGQEWDLDAIRAEMIRRIDALMETN